MSEEKTILIRSLEDLYALMIQNESIIYKDPQLCIIKDALDAAYTGCPCQRKNLENQALEILKVLNIHIDKEILSELKNFIGAEKIIVTINNEHLFDL